MAARFVPDPAGIAAMQATSAMVQAMTRRGERVVGYARLTGPYRTGNYSRCWRIYSGVRNGKAWCRVANVARYAAFLEYGTRFMKRQRILARSVAATRR